jgi:hypothetical protein
MTTSVDPSLLESFFDIGVHFAFTVFYWFQTTHMYVVSWPTRKETRNWSYLRDLQLRSWPTFPLTSQRYDPKTRGRTS